VTDFPLFIDGNGTTSGTQVTLDAGPHTVSETGQAGYAATITGDCAANGSITLNPGDVKACTITNDDIAPSLTLNKVVVNDSGGTAAESAWMLTANGGAAGTLSGPGANGAADVVSGPTFRAGTYALSESAGPGGYAASAWSCAPIAASGSNVTLGLGQSTTCTITNDDVPPNTFDGFDEPYAPPAPGTYNGQTYTLAKTFKLGSTLPLKFGYKFNGVRVDSANANPTISIFEFACADTFNSGTATEVAFTDPGNSTLTYDAASKTWHRNLQLKAGFKGDTCYYLRVTSSVATYGVSDYTPFKVKK